MGLLWNRRPLLRQRMSERPVYSVASAAIASSGSRWTGRNTKQVLVQFLLFEPKPVFLQLWIIHRGSKIFPRICSHGWYGAKEARGRCILRQRLSGDIMYVSKSIQFALKNIVSCSTCLSKDSLARILYHRILTRTALRISAACGTIWTNAF